MKHFRLLLFFFFITAAYNLQAQNELVPALPSARQVLDNATAAAAGENKKVLLMFHASWCGWCHKMDSSLNDVSCKKYFDDHFVIAHITVLESKDKKNFENEGALEMMEHYNGKNQGLPYWVILDQEQKLLFDSQIRKKQPDGTVKGQNTGCPANQEEVDFFMQVLKKTTTLTDDQLAIIAMRFRQNEN